MLVQKKKRVVTKVRGSDNSVWGVNLYKTDFKTNVKLPKNKKERFTTKKNFTLLHINTKLMILGRYDAA